jgi:hypothetical protein
MSFRRVLDENDYKGADLVWLLVVDWGGAIYRFSNLPIEVPYEDGDHQFHGQLDQLDYVEQSDLFEISVEANSVSVAVVFPHNMVQEFRAGRILDGARAELSYIMVRNGQPLQNWEERILLFEGEISQPIIGDPEEPEGFAAFSIEQQPYDMSGYLLDLDNLINISKFPQLPNDIGPGKPYPLVFGNPSNSIRSDGANVPNLHSTPAYPIDVHTGGEGGSHDYLMIAGHKVEASKVMIRDGDYRVATVDVEEAKDTNGVLYSYVDIHGSSVYTADASGHSNKSYFTKWYNPTGAGSYAGAHLNPFGDGLLEGGGDLIMFALSKTGMAVDWEAWGSVAQLLNDYRFAGYVNEPRITAWDWLNQNILPLMPVSVVSGPYGLRPVIFLQYFQGQRISFTTHILEGSDFQRISALEAAVGLDEIFNAIELRYAKDGTSGNYMSYYSIGADLEYTPETLDFDGYATLSQQRYGLRRNVIETNYVYDTGTAGRIARYLLRANCLVKRRLTYRAAPKYGYLMIGDVIGLSSETLFLTEQIATIVSKKWDGTSWLYDILIEDNPYTTPRGF